MVIRNSKNPIRRQGALMVELLVAIAILTGALIPLGYSLVSEHRVARASYQRAVAMEIVDGEMEILAAGEWKEFKFGTQPYPIDADAAKNLPDGQFLLTIETNHIRLEWRPSESQQGGAVVREVTVQ